MDIVDALVYPNFPSTESVSGALRDIVLREAGICPPGQYAIAWRDGATAYLARDPLGCNKLFYGFCSDGRLVVTNRIRKALELGIALDDLISCPPGHVLRVTDQQATIIAGQDLSSCAADENFDLAAFQGGVLQDLEDAFIDLRETHPNAAFALCLSGGLDSAGVAALARQHLPGVTAFSFSYLASTEAMEDPPHSETSEDFCAAQAIARALDLKFVPVFRPREAIASAIETAVRLCQDWRDFNVHCAVVNLFLAQSIRAHFPESEVVVLTGDLMNEYLCDYEEEIIDGVRYYPQPRIPREKLRRFLVRGLDAGDREIGLFHAFGLPVRQIYSAVAARYMRVPGELLVAPNAKRSLNGHLIPDNIKSLVARSKRRAQVGGADGGTLGGFHKLGVDLDRLKKIWRVSLPQEARGSNCHDIIRVGRYRTEVAARAAA